MVCNKCGHKCLESEERLPVDVFDMSSLPADEFLVAGKTHPSITYKSAQFYEERVPMILLDKRSRDSVGAVTGGIVNIVNTATGQKSTAMVQVQFREFIGQKIATLNNHLMSDLGIPVSESGNIMWGPYVVKIDGGDARAEAEFLTQYEPEIRQMMAESQRASGRELAIELAPIIEMFRRRD